MGRLVIVFAFAWLAATACSLHQSSSAATGAHTQTPVGSPLAPANSAMDAEVAMPAGFPADFPIYPHSRLTAAAAFASSGQVAWGMEWESADDQTRVAEYFTKHLNEADWVLGGTSSPSGAFTATFTRKSDKNVQGQITAEWNATATRILVSLAYPT